MPTISSKEYWEKRSELNLIRNEKSASQYERQLKKAYEETIRSIRKEVQAFYQRYSDETGVTLASARKRLKPDEQMDFQKQARKYLDEVEKFGDKAFTAEYRNYLKKLSGRAYISQMDELVTNIRHNIETLSTGYNAGLGNTLKDAYEDEYFSTMFDAQKRAGVGISFTTPGDKQLETAIREKWLGQNYSDRIWTDKKKLTDNIEQMLSQEFVRGRGPNDIARDFADRLRVSYSNAQRLIRTEINYISNKGSLQAYKDTGIVEKYRYLATLDSRTSDICRELDGEVFEIKEAKVGVNLPPLHPYCRSTTVPHFDDDDIGKLIEDRIARDGDGAGKSIRLGENLKFFDWVDKYGSESFKKKVATQRAKFKEMDKPMDMNKVSDELAIYVGGGYSSVKYAVSESTYKYIKDNMEETSEPLYRVEDARFTYDNIEVGETFEFVDDIRSFTRNRNGYLGKMLKEGLDEDIWQEPVVFETVGKVKHFNMDKFAENYYEDQSESLVGGKFEVVGEGLKEIDGVWINVVRIKAVEQKNNKSAKPKKVSEPLPRTLQRLSDHEKQWYQDRTLSKVSREEAATIDKALKDLADNNDLAMRVPGFRILDKIIDGGFKTQFETNSSGGTLDTSSRKEATKQLFGLTKEQIDELDLTEFEKYGYLASRDVKEDFSDMNEASQYGEICVRFKREKVAERTTMTVDDSLGPALNERIIATSIINPKTTSIKYTTLSSIKKQLPEEINKNINQPHLAIKAAWGSYFELQFHGKLTIEDVESIAYTKRDGKGNEDVIEKIKKLGIKVYEIE